MVDLDKLEEKIYEETEEYYKIEESINNFDIIADEKIKELTTQSETLWEQAKKQGLEKYQETIIDYLIAQGGITAIKDNKIVMLEILNNKAKEVNAMTEQLEEGRSDE